MDLALIFAAGFGSVFMLGFQSRNVNSGNYGWAAATSFMIAMMQTMLWGQLFANLTLVSAVIYGLSGAFGITLSMWTHQRFIGQRRPRR